MPFDWGYFIMLILAFAIGSMLSSALSYLTLEKLLKRRRKSLLSAILGGEGEERGEGPLLKLARDLIGGEEEGKE